MSAVALFTLIQSASAQSANERSALQCNTITQPFLIIQQLAPVNLSNTFSSTQKSELFSFDIPKIKLLLPELIRTETVWGQKGKNNQTATSKETVDFAQLVPVLVAALQQQNAEINELKLKLDRLQKQSNPGEAAK